MTDESDRFPQITPTTYFLTIRAAYESRESTVELRFVLSARMLLLDEVVGSSPAGKHLERVGSGTVRRRRVDVESQTGLARQFHRLVVEVELTDHRVPQPLLPAAVELHVVRGPAMKTRHLGSLEVSAVGLGTMGFSHGYPPGRRR